MSLFESIYVGFWKHFSQHVEKTTPPLKAKSLNYAAVQKLYRRPRGNAGNDLETVKKNAADVLGYIVQIIKIKKYSMDVRFVMDAIRYNGPTMASMFTSLNVITVACMMHIKNVDAPANAELYRCTGETSMLMKDDLENMLRNLVVFTGCELRELAIFHQEFYDPEGFLIEKLAGDGLLFSPPRYV